MIEYIIPIICFVGGLTAGVGTVAYGFRLGFRASYEIREGRGDEVTEDKGLLGKRKDPAEFDLLTEEEGAKQ